MTIQERKKAISQLTDFGLLNHERELRDIYDRLQEDIQLVGNEIDKRARKVIKRNNPKNPLNQ